MKIIYIFNNFQGFGDNIRGLISIKQIQKILNFELIIDFNNHAFKDFLNYNTPSYENVQKHMDYMFYDESVYHSNIINDLQHYKNISLNCISISTNAFPEINKIDNEIKLFIKDILALKPKYDEYFKIRFNNLPNEYNLFHYRFGDDYLIEKKEFNNKLYLHNFLINKKENSLVISDSLSFKIKIHDICINDDVFVYMNNPYHTKVMNNDTIQNNINLDTLCDFMLMKNAKSIYCYSQYNWISNFILWTSIIYDIPLNNLKNTNTPFPLSKIKIYYGIENNKIDITNICLMKCIHNNILHIPRGDINRYNIFGIDPCYGIVKSVFISFTCRKKSN
jgi:hypothetical protein